METGPFLALIFIRNQLEYYQGGIYEEKFYVYD